MTDSFSSVRGARKSKKDLLSSRSSAYSGNSTISETYGGRLSLFPGFRPQKLLANNSSDKLSFHGEKDASTYENYELDYSSYLLRKLQTYVLFKSKKEKEESLKKCLVSLKIELEDLLEKHVTLNRTSSCAEMYMNTIKECNKRIELGKIIEDFKSNRLDDLFKSVSSVLDKSVNQIRLIGVSKEEMETIFTREVLGEKSDLIKSLNNIQNFSMRNKKIIEKIAEEIVKIENLVKNNSALRERFLDIFHSITSEILDGNYKSLTSIIKKAVERRLDNETEASSLLCGLFEVDELMLATLKHSTDAMQSLQLSKFNSMLNEKPNGSSTPQFESR